MEAASHLENKRKAAAVEVRDDMEEQLQQRRQLQQLARVMMLRFYKVAGNVVQQ